MNIIERLQNADVHNDEEFRELLTWCRTAEAFTDAELATEFTVSVPTIKRWRLGETIPHPQMRRAVFTYLASRAKDLISK